MKCRIKTFGIAREIMQGNDLELELTGKTVGDLRQLLAQKYPRLNGLNSLFIAVNHSYAGDDLTLSETDEVAIIPPVSGG